MAKAIGLRVPNANADGLAAVGEALARLGETVEEKTDDVGRVARPPSSAYGEDAQRTLEEWQGNILASSGRLTDHATRLASSATDFSHALVGRHKEISDEIDSMAWDIGITVAIGLLATVVTAAGSDVAAGAVTVTRITLAGRRIAQIARVLGREMTTVSSRISQLEATYPDQFTVVEHY